jgi:hypothetical protein
MSSNHTAQTCADNQDLEHNGSSGIVQSVVEKLEDRDSGQTVGNILEITDNAEQHGYNEAPAGNKSDSDGTHDCDRDHTLRLMDFFRKMSRTIEAGKCPIGVDQSSYEGNTSIGPTSVIDERREYKFGTLMAGCCCRYSSQDYDKGDQRAVKTSGCNRGQNLSVAIEQETDPCKDEVSRKDMIVLDDVIGMRELPATD